ncbi:hypothetical protein [Ruegeria arenilitoris]|uniref:hypothetical protein n=1 Tax=Ruegeria arenilitoris TaxID=1173585 RepID=UPI00147C983E|nr:hypothetical protein [Ruegeria arenilitoris]
MHTERLVSIGAKMALKGVRARVSLRVAISCFLLLIALPVSSKESFDPQGYFVNPDEANMSDLANYWWQWFYSIPKIQNPRLDPTGIHCAAMQSGEVWFLADAEPGEITERKCQVPFGKSLFFTVINNIGWTPPGVEQSCDEAIEGVDFEPVSTDVIEVKLNGTPFPNPALHLVGSADCFDILDRIPSEYNPPSYYPSATDGYWFMLKPLPVGTYDLSISAISKWDGGQKTIQDVRYLIEVIPE